MAVYYFDFREGDAFVVDEEGMELRDVEAAQAEAARSLSGIAWDAMRSAGAQAQEMTIEVRDVYGPVMDVKFAFVINRKQSVLSPGPMAVVWRGGGRGSSSCGSCSWNAHTCQGARQKGVRQRAQKQNRTTR